MPEGIYCPGVGILTLPPAWPQAEGAGVRINEKTPSLLKCKRHRLEKQTPVVSYGGALLLLAAGGAGIGIGEVQLFLNCRQPY